MSENSITVRHPQFEFSKDTPRHYWGGNAIATHLANALHIVFPAGEKLFIRAARHYLPDVADPKLKKAIKAFIAQETIHGKEHEKFWDVMREHGLPVDEFIKFYESTAYEMTEPFVIKHFGPVAALSVTVALEHYTAILAESAFRDGILEGLPEDLADLFGWHAAEEIEHKAVAYDLLKEVDDSYSTRMAGYALGSFVLLFYGFGGMLYFLSKDPEFKLSNVAENLKSLTSMSSMLSKGFRRSWLDFLRPDFHPNDLDQDKYAREFFETFSRGKKDKAADTTPIAQPATA